MRAVSTAKIVEHREIERTLVQGSARLCRVFFRDICKGIFPTKTAEDLAFYTDQSVRAAGYELSGDRAPSPKSIALIAYVAAHNQLPPKLKK